MVETPHERPVEERAAGPAERARDAQSGRPARRDLALAVWRGLTRCCPKCGQGALFRSYLGVNSRCPACGEDLSAERADDAPAFVTLFIACFVGGASVLLWSAAFPQAPLLLAAFACIAVTALVSLLILRRIKGAVVGAEWALRMHGFAAGTKPEQARRDARQP